MNGMTQEKLQQIVEKLCVDFQVPSIMASIHTNGKTFFVGSGLSDLENAYAATPDTIYAIASASKAFIATALCVLADDGKLSLDDRVIQHMPDFAMFDPYMTEHLTIRDALGHRSGLPRHDLMWFNQPDLTVHEIVQRVRYLPPAFEPRARMHYQNLMFSLASVLVERLTGMAWQDFVKLRLLDPLGMTSTYTRAKEYRDLGTDNVSQPYGLADGVVTKVPYNFLDNVGCAGCISSTVRDLDKWARLHQGRGVFEGKRIFSDAMADNLHNPQMIIKSGEMFAWDFPGYVDMTAYGQGWFIESYRGHKLVHHGGTIDGYKSLVGFMPNEDVAFSILTNLNGNQSPSALGYYICDVLLGLEEIDWSQKLRDAMAVAAEKVKTANDGILQQTVNPPAASHAIEDYAGTYTHPGYGSLGITAENGRVVCHFIGQQVELTHAGHDSYILYVKRHGVCMPLQFVGGFDGKITKLLIKADDKCDFAEFLRG